MLLIGIDPGKSGGVAWLGPTLAGAFTPGAAAMPKTERETFELIYQLVADKDGLAEADTFAVIERVHSMPRQGVASSFTFGRGYGFLRGCLTALRVPFEEVTPQRWQKTLGCLSRGDKHALRARAQQLFPGLKVTLATADALLLAWYARMTYGNGAANRRDDVQQTE